MLSRYRLLQVLSEMLPDDALVVSCIGNNSGFWGQIKERQGNLFHITMGMCTPAALGLSSALPHRKVVCLDADGNILLNLGAIATVANHGSSNLLIIVFDNENYLGSIKNQSGPPTATKGKLDLAAVAEASGIASSSKITSLEDFRARVQTCLTTDGPHFIVAKIEPLDSDKPPRVRRIPDTKENKYQFVHYIEETEKVSILGAGLGKFDR
jgi:thiamine pyrophosphate-dependent acetolactate synthase large subunit-like protein